MTIRALTVWALAAVAVWSSWVPNVEADPVAIVNPGFDATVTGLDFIYEDMFYTADNPMPDHTFTFEDLSGNGDNISGIGDSATGAVIADATVEFFGYTSSPGAGIVHDTRDYLTGEGSDGPGAYISMGDNLPRGIFQLLEGTPFAPNTTYTFTAEVSDRRFGPDDNVTFPSGGDIVPTGIHLSLAGDVEQSTGMFSFTTPPAGGTSLATLVFTTGPDGTPGDPTGDITLVIRAQGFAGGAASQAVFDNLTLDATPTEPPVGVPGDYNGNNIVDAADYTQWRDNLGASITLSNEVSDVTPGSATQEDYDAWVTRFGNTSGSGSVLGSTAVPEPASLSILLISLLSCIVMGTLHQVRRLGAAGG